MWAARQTQVGVQCFQADDPLPLDCVRVTNPLFQQNRLFRLAVVDGGTVREMNSEELEALAKIDKVVSERIAAEQAAAQVVTEQAITEARAAQNERVARIEGLRAFYRDTTHAFCTLAEIVEVDKLDSPDIAAAVQAAGTGPIALPLTQLAFSLFVQIIDLRRLDGDDAWERI